MKKDITDLVTTAAVIPDRLKKLEKLMKYKDGIIYQKKDGRRDKHGKKK